MPEDARERTACMMRVRNEGRWLRGSLERTFQVAKTVVLLDDGSSDNTLAEAFKGFGLEERPADYALMRWRDEPPHAGVEVHSRTDEEGRERFLRILRSPFTGMARPHMRVSEIRDKTLLWEYCKVGVDFDTMICLDGDEVLSKRLVSEWYQVNDAIAQGHDVVHLPFVYLWDHMNRRRIDGIYGDNAGNFAILNFPRVFSVKHVSPADFFEMRFAWQGTKGGFHCGSIPRERFLIDGRGPTAANVMAPVIHYGYLDDSMRRDKFEFYNRIDPGNKFEGEYKHIIGEPDVHAPGPVRFVDWSDT